MPEVSCIVAMGAAPRIHCAHKHKMNTFVMSGRRCWRVSGLHLNELPHQSQISDTAESERRAWQLAPVCRASHPARDTSLRLCAIGLMPTTRGGIHQSTRGWRSRSRQVFRRRGSPIGSPKSDGAARKRVLVLRRRSRRRVSSQTDPRGAGALPPNETVGAGARRVAGVVGVGRPGRVGAAPPDRRA
jgi:hypothetical protein